MARTQKTITLQDLAKTKDAMRNYVVFFKCFGAKSHLRCHVGFGSQNHLQTLQDLLRKEYGGYASIESVKVDTSTARFDFGFGGDAAYERAREKSLQRGE